MMDNPRARGEFSDAMSAVYGIATCRMTRSNDAAAAIVQDYIGKAMAEGKSVAEAWSLFFSAAVVAITDMAEAAAEAEGSTPLHILSQAAMAHAAAQAPA